MPTTSQDTLREHAKAAHAAAEFFQQLARNADLPLTEQAFEERVRQFVTDLDKRLALSNAIVMAVLRDEPMPQSAFALWASPSVIWHWRNAKKNPLPTVELNGKIAIKPSDFFTALKLHGKASA